MIVLPLKVTLRFVALKMDFVESFSNAYAEILVEMRLLAQEDRKVVEAYHGVLRSIREIGKKYVIASCKVGVDEDLDSFLE